MQWSGHGCSSGSRARRTVHSGAIDILVVCTGNTCRSAMAEALLRVELAERGIGARVHSAGTTAWRGGASEGARAAMADRGIDLAEHRTRSLAPQLVRDADLVLGMTRTHVWSVGVHAPDAATRAFLPAELARLGEAAGARGADEAIDAWVARVAALRPDPRVPGRPQDEVPDPAGEPVEAYRATAERLAGELGRVARLIGGPLGGSG